MAVCLSTGIADFEGLELRAEPGGEFAKVRSTERLVEAQAPWDSKLAVGSCLRDGGGLGVHVEADVVGVIHGADRRRDVRSAAPASVPVTALRQVLHRTSPA